MSRPPPAWLLDYAATIFRGNVEDLEPVLERCSVAGADFRGVAEPSASPPNLSDTIRAWAVAETASPRSEIHGFRFELQVGPEGWALAS